MTSAISWFGIGEACTGASVRKIFPAWSSPMIAANWTPCPEIRSSCAIGTCRSWSRKPAYGSALSKLEKYCLKIPGVLGGAYGGDNLASSTLVELIESSGHMAMQIADLPDGTQVKLRVTE